jgi:hypothetical protein
LVATRINTCTWLSKAFFKDNLEIYSEKNSSRSSSKEKRENRGCETKEAGSGESWKRLWCFGNPHDFLFLGGEGRKSGEFLSPSFFSLFAFLRVSGIIMLIRYIYLENRKKKKKKKKVNTY